MRAGWAVLAGVGVVLAALVAGVWIVPGLLDWGRYRDSIEELATAGLGRPVRIAGAVTLHLLPEPVLTAADVVVAQGGEGGDILDGGVLRARELRLRVALGPLLAGRVEARDLTLRGADLRLPWPPVPGALARRPPTWLSGLQAQVEEGRIQVGGLVVDGIGARLATDPDTGSLSASGVGRVGGASWRFTARLTEPGRDGSAALDASLDGQGPLQDTGGTFAGTIAGDGALAGRVAGRGPDLARLMPAPPVAWRADGRLSAAAGLAVADELALQIGGSPARGAVALRVLPEARLDLALAAGRLDLDAWLPVLARGTDLALPTGLDLSAEAAALAGGTLRRVRGAFDLDRDGVTLRQGQALLPGDAQLSLSGRLTRSGDGGGPGQVDKGLADKGTADKAEGTAHLAAPDLRATLAWLAPLLPAGGLPAGFAPGVLRTADLRANVAAGGGQASLSDLAGTLDGSALTGELAVKLGPRLGLDAGLSFDRLALDPWLPDPKLLATSAGMTGALARAAAIDADIRLHAKRATLRGVPFGGLDAEVQTEATRLTLRRLEAAPMGARLTASGAVGEGGRVLDGLLDISAPDLALLHPLLPPGFPLAPLARGPGTLSLTLAGPPDALAARLVVEAAGVRLEAQPVLALASRRWAGPVMLHHPGAPRLLETLGVPGAAAWLGDGSLSLLAQVAAAPGRIDLDRFSLVAASLRATGQLTLEGRMVSGQVAAEVLPLPLPYPGSRDPLPVWALLGWGAALRVDAAQVLLGQAPALQALSADVLLQDGTLRVPRATARLPEGALSGTLAGSALLEAGTDPPRLEVHAGLADAALSGPLLDAPLDLASGQGSAQLDVSAAGHSPAALLATATGSAGIAVQDGVLSGLDLPAAAAALSGPDPARIAPLVRAALLAGTTPFTRLDLAMPIQHGILSAGGALEAPAGGIQVGGTLDLLGAADLRLLVRPAVPDQQPGPELGLLLAGPLGSTRTPELAGLSRWLADRPGG